MVSLRTRWSRVVDDQHRQPTGVLGTVIGERMVRQHTPETEWSIELLQLRREDWVLDLGCGAGRGLALAAHQCPQGRVVGVDLSPTMVQSSRRRNKVALREGSVVLFRTNLATLPFAPGSFDKIMSIHTLYFWPDPLGLLHELARLLRPGGTAVITLSTGQKASSGELIYGTWQQRLAEEIVPALQGSSIGGVSLEYGPFSRQYNNVALVIHN